MHVLPTARSPERRQVQRPNPCAGRRARWSGCHPRSHLCRSLARQAPLCEAQARDDRRCDRLFLGNCCLGRRSRVPARSESSPTNLEVPAMPLGTDKTRLISSLLGNPNPLTGTGPTRSLTDPSSSTCRTISWTRPSRDWLVSCHIKRLNRTCHRLTAPRIASQTGSWAHCQTTLGNSLDLPVCTRPSSLPVVLSATVWTLSR